MKTKRIFWLVIAVLYAITWIGGYRLHSLALKKQAQTLYNESRSGEAVAALDRENIGSPAQRSDLLPGGPAVVISWCVPTLPGVLVADSGYIVGSLRGGGGIRILIYYGFDLWDSEPFGGWVM